MYSENKFFIEDVPCENKLIALRCDLNVPLQNGCVQDETRIKESLQTIRYLQEQKARTFIISHLGRPKGKIQDELRLRPVAERLSEILGTQVMYASDCVGEDAKAKIASLQKGDIALLENVRFHREEIQNDPSFSKKLSHGADYFVNDAFGTAHREHCSNCGITRFVPLSLMGYLIRKETLALEKISQNPRHPFAVICGGVKISDKIDLIESLTRSADQILIGGAMAFTFLRAKNIQTGNSLVEEDKVEIAKNLLAKAKEKILLPLDLMVSSFLDLHSSSSSPKISIPLQLISLDIQAVPDGYYAVDIGPKTIAKYQAILSKAKTIFWNGPMGIFEIAEASQGTFATASMIAKLMDKNDIYSVIGGGDSAAAITQSGFKDKVSHVSTGGGASLEFLNQAELPALSLLSSKEASYQTTGRL